MPIPTNQIPTMAKVTHKLTPATIKAKAKPGPKSFKLAVGQGLYLFGKAKRRVLMAHGVPLWRPAETASVGDSETHAMIEQVRGTGA